MMFKTVQELWLDIITGKIKSGYSIIDNAQKHAAYARYLENLTEKK